MCPKPVVPSALPPSAESIRCTKLLSTRKVRKTFSRHYWVTTVGMCVMTIIYSLLLLPQARTLWLLKVNAVTTANKRAMAVKPNPSSERRLRPLRKSFSGEM